MTRFIDQENTFLNERKLIISEENKLFYDRKLIRSCFTNSAYHEIYYPTVIHNF